MVSLSNDRIRSGGFFGFSEDVAAINSTLSDDELLVDHLELVSSPEMSHKPINTSWAIIVTKLLYVILGVSSYVLPQVCGNGNCGDDAISLTMYIHGGMWFLMCALDKYFDLQHNKSRMNGYLDFNRQTENLRRLPITIHSCANAVLVVVTKLLDSHCDSQGHCKGLSKSHYIQITITLECVVAIGVLLVYLVKTLKFNSKKALPDVAQSDQTTGFEGPCPTSDVGCRNDKNYYQQVMEKQADMIQYLKQHAEILAKKNLKLTDESAKLRELKKNDAHK